MVEVFKQVGILFAFMGAGYLLAKLDLIKAEHGKMLSTLILYVFLPCNIFRTFATSSLDSLALVFRVQPG